MRSERKSKNQNTDVTRECNDVVPGILHKIVRRSKYMLTPAKPLILYIYTLQRFRLLFVVFTTAHIFLI
jgi:hypothetical protein